MRKEEQLEKETVEVGLGGRGRNSSLMESLEKESLGLTIKKYSGVNMAPWQHVDP